MGAGGNFHGVGVWFLRACLDMIEGRWGGSGPRVRRKKRKRVPYPIRNRSRGITGKDP